MDKRSLVLFLSGLAAAGAVMVAAASCSDQPRIKCTAGHGPFAVKYIVTGGDAMGCGMKGELIGVEAYNYALPDRSNVDPNHGSLGLQTALTDELVGAHGDDPDKSKPYAIGDWASAEPGADNFCTVPSPTAVDLALPAIPPADAGADGNPPADPGAPATTLKYVWSSVKVYNTPAAPGTQLSADLDFTLGSCNAKFHVIGLWPAVGCSVDLGDGGVGFDETLCSSEPDLSKDRALGSGISPDLATVCDHDIGYCMLAKEPPSFK